MSPPFPSLTLDAKTLGILFPAHVACDRDGMILGCGASLQRHIGCPLIGQPFFDWFEVERPVRLDDWEALMDVRRTVIIRAIGRAELRLRGVVRRCGEACHILLSHIPHFSNDSDKQRLNASDFAPTDGTLDAILAGQMNQSLLEDARNLAEQLSQKRDEAERASAAKSAFLANMSHEIRTPLNAILGMASVLEHDELSAKQHEMVTLICSGARALSQVLNDVLDLSKVEAGKLELSVEPFTVDSVLDATKSLFAHAADDKGLSFDVVIEPSAGGRFENDPLRIRQILNNLVSNAVKFTERGAVGVRAWFETGESDREGMLAFAVSDTGQGLSVDAQQRIFQAFVQSDGSISRSHGGTGLGLAICKQLSALMGGDVVVDSTEGRGSTFTLTVRATRLGDGQLTHKDDRVGGGADDVPDLSGLKILAAEDNLVNQKVLEACLAAANPSVVFVGNGAEAVQAWRECGGFDVILMDAQMPVLDGVQATKEIRRLEADLDRRGVTIFALTANVMEHQVEAYRAAGVDGVMGKPIDRKELLGALAGVLAAGGDASGRSGGDRPVGGAALPSSR